MPKIKSATKESRLEKIRSSLIEVPTTTSVKAWTFQIEKQYYVVISFFAPRFGQQIAVFPSNKKGVKSSNKEIVSLWNSKDYVKGMEEALKVLIPEEFAAENSEQTSNVE